MRTENDTAIVVYLDDHDRIESELWWLYKSWILHALDREIDLVVYHHPQAVSRVERFRDREQVVAIPLAPRGAALDYPFLNSVYPLVEPADEPLRGYQWILKTDCDVFLTHNLKRFRPDRLMIGEGAYCADDAGHREAMARICRHFGFSYRGIANVGSSWFGATEEILRLSQLQARFTEFLLSPESDEPFWNHYRGVYRNVSTMFGGEMAVNQLYEPGDFHADALDTKCSNRTIDAQVRHIHAWHIPAFWSKHQYAAGRYDDIRIDFVDAFEKTCSYCHWVASTPIDEIRRLRELILKLSNR